MIALEGSCNYFQLKRQAMTNILGQGLASLDLQSCLTWLPDVGLQWWGSRHFPCVALGRSGGGGLGPSASCCLASMGRSRNWKSRKCEMTGCCRGGYTSSPPPPFPEQTMPQQQLPWFLGESPKQVRLSLLQCSTSPILLFPSPPLYQGWPRIASDHRKRGISAWSLSLANLGGGGSPRAAPACSTLDLCVWLHGVPGLAEDSNGRWVSTSRIFLFAQSPWVTSVGQEQVLEGGLLATIPIWALYPAAESLRLVGETQWRGR